MKSGYRQALRARARPGELICDRLQRAISLALKLDHHLFDTLYHAVALEEKATLITADRKYYDKVRRMGSILMLEEFDG